LKFVDFAGKNRRFDLKGLGVVYANGLPVVLFGYHIFTLPYLTDHYVADQPIVKPPSPESTLLNENQEYV